MPLGVASSNPPNFSTAPMNDRCNSGVQRRRAFSELAPADVFELPERFPPLPSLTGADVIARSPRPADADADADARFLRPRPPARPTRSAPPPSSPSTAKLPISNPSKSSPPSPLPTAANPSSRRSNTSSNQSYTRASQTQPSPASVSRTQSSPVHRRAHAHARPVAPAHTKKHPRHARCDPHHAPRAAHRDATTPERIRGHRQNILIRIAHSLIDAPAHRARRASRRRDRHRPHRRRRRRRRARLRTARTCPRRGTSTRAARRGVSRARSREVDRWTHRLGDSRARCDAMRAFAGAIAAGEWWMDDARARAFDRRRVGDRRRAARARASGASWDLGLGPSYVLGS